jgi:hypothetical protein
MNQQQFDQLLPLAAAWVAQQEQLIFGKGVPLSPQQIHDAKSVGVLHPERVRLLNVGQVPMPEQPALRSAVEQTGVISPNTIGLCVRYGIFLRSDCWTERRLLIHELVHTSQYERMGGIPQFLKQYLWECVTGRYPNTPMEQEAVLLTAKLCGA